MTRLLLIANANAQAATPRRLEVMSKALSADYKVQVTETKRRGHATHVARGAVHEGYDVVVAMGGDGTVNEVANGLAGTWVPMGILPAGGTNVFARLLGIPRDLVEAAAVLLENGLDGARRVPLGRADGRHFTFSCGVGFDAAIVRQVERRQRLKKAVGEWYYVWSGLRLFFMGYDRRVPHVRLSWGDDLEEHRDGLFVALCQNAPPFTYLGRREFKVCPDVDIDRGLDCFALDTMRTTTALRTVISAFGAARHVRFRHAIYVHDQRRLRIECDRALPLQMDGEYVGERDGIDLELVPDALSVLT